MDNGFAGSVTRYPIREPFARRTLYDVLGPLLIFDAERLAIVVAEIEFGEVPGKVFLTHVLVRPEQPALEHAEKVFDRIGVIVAAHVFLGAVVYRAVAASEHPLRIAIRASFVRF